MEHMWTIYYENDFGKPWPLSRSCKVEQFDCAAEEEKYMQALLKAEVKAMGYIALTQGSRDYKRECVLREVHEIQSRLDGRPSTMPRASVCDYRPAYGGWDLH